MRKKLEIRNLGESNFEVLLYGDIGGWDGFTAANIRSLLDEVNASSITLRIHSYGGDALEGLAIMNVLREYPAAINAVVDGVCASAATVIAIGGAERLSMAETAELMIHSPWVFADGDSADLRKAADRLDHVAANYAQIYAAKSGISADEWLGVLADETWYSAAEAVSIGLADEVTAVTPKTVDPVAAAVQSLVFAKYKYSGRGSAPDPVINNAHVGQEGKKNMDFLASIAQRLGVDGKSDEATVLAALDEVLAEQASREEQPEPAGAATAEIDPGLSVFTKANVERMLKDLTNAVDAPSVSSEASEDMETEEQNSEEPAEESTDEPADGVINLDKDVYEDLLRRAALGDQASEDNKQREAEELVAAAIKAGKVLAVKHDQLVAAAVEDYDGLKSYFAQLAPGLIPTVEKGRGGSDEARGIGIGASAAHTEKNQQADRGRIFQRPTI
ncbi:head maturation protease, ClpP-related [Corynebacterium diphtheriae]